MTAPAVLALAQRRHGALLRFAEGWHPVTKGGKGIVPALEHAEEQVRAALALRFQRQAAVLGTAVIAALPALLARQSASATVKAAEPIDPLLDAKAIASQALGHYAEGNTDEATAHKTVYDALNLAAQSGYQSTMGYLGMGAPSNVRYNLVNAQAKIWLAGHTQVLFRQIDESTGNQIAKTLSAGLTKGEHLEELGQRVAKVLKTGPEWRARMIAQDQTIAAHALAAEHTASGLGLNAMEWLDGQPGACPKCQGLHGKVKLLNGGDGLYHGTNGDAAHPGAHPGCRCTQVPHFPDDLNDLNLPMDEIDGLKNAVSACPPALAQAFAEIGAAANAASAASASFCEIIAKLPGDGKDTNLDDLLKMNSIALGNLLASHHGMTLGNTVAHLWGQMAKAYLNDKVNDAIPFWDKLGPKGKQQWLQAKGYLSGGDWIKGTLLKKPPEPEISMANLPSDPKGAGMALLKHLKLDTIVGFQSAYVSEAHKLISHADVEALGGLTLVLNKMKADGWNAKWQAEANNFAKKISAETKASLLLVQTAPNVNQLVKDVLGGFPQVKAAAVVIPHKPFATALQEAADELGVPVPTVSQPALAAGPQLIAHMQQAGYDIPTGYLSVTELNGLTLALKQVSAGKLLAKQPGYNNLPESIKNDIHKWGSEYATAHGMTLWSQIAKALDTPAPFVPTVHPAEAVLKALEAHVGHPIPANAAALDKLEAYAKANAEYNLGKGGNSGMSDAYAALPVALKDAVGKVNTSTMGTPAKNALFAKVYEAGGTVPTPNYAPSQASTVQGHPAYPVLHEIEKITGKLALSIVTPEALNALNDYLTQYQNVTFGNLQGSPAAVEAILKTWNDLPSSLQVILGVINGSPTLKAEFWSHIGVPDASTVVPTPPGASFPWAIASQKALGAHVVGAPEGGGPGVGGYWGTTNLNVLGKLTHDAMSGKGFGIAALDKMTGTGKKQLMALVDPAGHGVSGEDIAAFLKGKVAAPPVQPPPAQQMSGPTPFDIGYALSSKLKIALTTEQSVALGLYAQKKISNPDIEDWSHFKEIVGAPIAQKLLDALDKLPGQSGNFAPWAIQEAQALGITPQPVTMKMGAGIPTAPKTTAAPSSPNMPYDVTKPPFDVNAAPKANGQHLGGAHAKTVITDPEGKQWMFKPAQDKPYQASAEVVVQSFANAVGMVTPQVYVTRVGGQYGSLQKLVPGIESEGWTQGKAKALSQTQLEQVQQHQVIDWLFSQHDTNAGAPLFLKDGRVVMIDKGQAFKFFGSDKLDPTYNPNAAFEPLMVYNDMWASHARGDVKLRWAAVEPLLRRIQAMDDQAFVGFLGVYASDAAKAGVLPGGELTKFLDATRKRKQDLIHDFEDLYKRLGADMEGARVVPRQPDKPPTVDADMVRRVNGTVYGQSLLTDHDVFESMDMQVRRVTTPQDEHFIRLETKLRNGPASVDLEKRLQALAREQGKLGKQTASAAPNTISDPLHDSVVALIKHVNTHAASDQTFTASKLTPVYTSVLQVNQIDAGAAAFFKAKYGPIFESLGTSWHEMAASPGAVQDMLGAKVKAGVKPWSGGNITAAEYVKPKAKEALPTATEQRGIKVVSYGPEVGRIAIDAQQRNIYNPGVHNSSVMGYNLELSDGTLVFYNPQGEGVTSAHGTLRVTRKAGLEATAADIETAFHALEEIGLPMGIASARDVEEMYLLQHFHTRKIQPPPAQSGVDRITQLNESFRQQVGIDLKASPSYVPVPQFDTVLRGGGIERSGQAYFQRADLRSGDIGDLVLTHDSSMSGATFLAMMDQSGGWLQPTEFRHNNQLATGVGASESSDRGTGGAAYVFTRKAHRKDTAVGTSMRFVFKPTLATRTTTVHYPTDQYGKTANFEASHIADPAKWKTTTGGGNESMVKNGFNVLEHVEHIHTRYAAEIITGLTKRFGPTSPYDGRPWTEIVIK